MIGSIILGPMITGAKMHRSIHRRSSIFHAPFDRSLALILIFALLFLFLSLSLSLSLYFYFDRWSWHNRMNQSTIALLLDERWIRNEISIMMHDIPLLVIHCWVWFGESHANPSFIFIPISCSIVIIVPLSLSIDPLFLSRSRSQWMLEKPHDDELAITCMIPDKAFDMIRSSIADAVVSRDSMRSPLSYYSSIILYLSLHVFPSSYSSIYLYFWVYLLSFIFISIFIFIPLFLFPIFLSIIPWPGFWHCNIPLGL